MILPSLSPRRRLAPTSIERAPLSYAPRSSTTLNHERLNEADPNFHRLHLRFCAEQISHEEDQFIDRLALRGLFGLGFFLYLAPRLAEAFSPVAAIFICTGVPLAIAVFSALMGHPQASGWRNVVWGLAFGTYAAMFDFTYKAGIFQIAAKPLLIVAGALFWISACLMLAYRWLEREADPQGVSASKALSFSSKTVERALSRGMAVYIALFFVGVAFKLSLPNALAELLAAVFARPALTLILGLSLAPIAAWSVSYLSTLCWMFLLHDPRVSGAPGLWSPTVWSAPARRALAGVSVAVFHVAIASVIAISVRRSDSFVAFVPLTAEQASLAGTTPDVGALAQTYGALGRAGASSLLSSEIILAALLPFVLLDKLYVRRAFAIAYHAGLPSRRAVYSHRLRNSPVLISAPRYAGVIKESDHLYVGYEPFQRFPVLLHRPLLHEHCYIVGDSGSGKTSLGLIPFVSDLIIGARSHASEDSAIVILDLKGDMALFETARRSAEAVGKTFRYFTPEPKQSSFFFNPFLDIDADGRRSPIQIAEMILDSLALNHGEGYGRSYYSRRSRDILLDALIQEPRPTSFDELFVILERLAQSQQSRYRDSFELLSTIRALTFYRQLNTKPAQHDPRRSIHMPQVLAAREVVYFWLPSATESVSVREIGKLALYSLLSAAIARRPPTEEARADDMKYGPRRAYLIIDEFQRIAGENFKVVLEQARSFGVGVILANQAISELKTAAADLRSVVKTNTRVKIFFSVQDAADLEEIAGLTGDDVVINESITISEPISAFSWRTATTRSRGTSYGVKPRLTPTDILAISDHPTRFILHVSRGSGLTQFGGRAIPVEGEHLTSAATYAEQSSALWPMSPDLPTSDTAPKELDQQARLETVQEQRKTVKSLFQDLSS